MVAMGFKAIIIIIIGGHWFKIIKYIVHIELTFLMGIATAPCGIVLL